jgi:hypothetical protein
MKKTATKSNARKQAEARALAISARASERQAQADGHRDERVPDRQLHPLTTTTTTRRQITMSNRVYDRQTIQWTADDLAALEQAGQATYFPKAFTYVVKLPEGGSVAVRPEQILPVDEEPDYDGFDPDMAYERWLEDGGRHAAAIQAEDDYERQLEAMDPGLNHRYNDDDDLVNHFSI